MQFAESISHMSEGSLDLTEEFPISRRTIVKRSWFFLLVLCVAVTLSVLFDLHSSGLILDDALYSRIRQILGVFLLFSTLLTGGKLIYEALCRRCYHYGIEAGHLVISKGVLLKERGSFPLSRITDVYLDRTLRDLFLGLYNLHVSTPTRYSGEFARIDGLTRKTAIALQNRLTGMLDMFPAHAEGGHTENGSASAERVVNWQTFSRPAPAIQ